MDQNRGPGPWNTLENVFVPCVPPTQLRRQTPIVAQHGSGVSWAVRGVWFGPHRAESRPHRQRSTFGRAIGTNTPTAGPPTVRAVEVGRGTSCTTCSSPQPPTPPLAPHSPSQTLRCPPKNLRHPNGRALSLAPCVVKDRLDAGVTTTSTGKRVTTRKSPVHAADRQVPSSNLICSPALAGLTPAWHPHPVVGSPTAGFV